MDGPADAHVAGMQLDGSFVFVVVVCSVVGGAAAGFGYWFFAEMVGGWGLDQHDFLASFEVELFGTVLFGLADSLGGVIVAWYGYMAFAPVLGGAVGAVMSLDRKSTR